MIICDWATYASLHHLKKSLKIIHNGIFFCVNFKIFKSLRHNKVSYTILVIISNTYVNVYFFCQKKHSSSDDIIRLEIGVFLNTFVKHIHSIIHGEQLNLTYEYTLSTEHMMIYSAHDTDVTYILAGFGVYNNQTINYASTVILELHGPDKSSNESDYRIKLLYKKGWTDETGEYLTLPACKGQPGYNGCPVNLVLEQIKPLLLSTDRFYKECSIDQPDSVNYRLHPIVFIFVGASISSVIMLLVFWYYSLRLRRYNSLDVTEQPIL